MKRYCAGLLGVILACTFLVTGLAQAEPQNLSALKATLRAYFQSGAYAVELAQVAQDAQDFLARRARNGGKLAIVLDIDETSLSNMPQTLANDFGFLQGSCQLGPSGAPLSPCGWGGWTRLGVAPVIAPTRNLAVQAHALGVAVFFITGRRESARGPTEANLRAVGYPQWAQLYMKADDAHFPTAVAFKTPIRRQIEAMGYSIIINMGDQITDLAGGHAERTYKLPNPFYLVP